MSKTNLLFVCSRNKWRSKTAETIFKDDLEYNVKSAGTSKQAVSKISYKILDWADKVFVMERKHKQIIELRFPWIEKEIIILNIPDEYQYMDPELIEELRSCVFNK